LGENQDIGIDPTETKVSNKKGIGTKPMPFLFDDAITENGYSMGGGSSGTIV